MNSIRRFDLDRQGIARVLGDLEADILQTVWALGEPTVKDVTEALGSSAHVKTVMTVMNRMVEKGLLNRHRRGRGYVYSATLAREAFLEHVVDQVLTGLLTDFGGASLAHFVSGATEEQLAELEQLIAKQRQDPEQTKQVRQLIAGRRMNSEKS
mgnify:CR=1 FL=1